MTSPEQGNNQDALFFILNNVTDAVLIALSESLLPEYAKAKNFENKIKGALKNELSEAINDLYQYYIDAIPLIEEFIRLNSASDITLPFSTFNHEEYETQVIGQIVNIIYKISKPLRQESKTRQKASGETKDKTITGFFFIDPTHQTSYWSKEAKKILCLPSLNETPESFNIFDFIHPEDRDKVRHKLNTAYNNNLLYNAMHRIINKDNRVITVHSTGSFIRNYPNQKLYIGAVQSIPSSHIRKDQIFRENAELKVLAENKSNMIRAYSQKDYQIDLIDNLLNSSLCNFTATLKNLNPTLTIHDMKHCACIRLHFETKEIAQYFNVLPASVQTSRARLKKKLKLPESTDLRNFIQNI